MPPSRRAALIRAVSLVASVPLAILCLTSCGRLSQTAEQAQVARTFAAWKTAMIDHQTDKAMTYMDGHVDDYLATLNSAPPTPPAPAHPATPPPPSASNSPGVDHLLRTALDKKVPAELRPKLTLAALMRRIAARHLFNPRDVRQIDLGPISIDGDHATAEVYYQGTLTALRLPFLKEHDAWKIDVLGLLPYAEVLMRVDRAIKGETETQQVDQLVSKLPAL